MKEKPSYFEKTLKGFTYDVASLGAVRHLADLGLSVKEIMERLDFPTPRDLVQKTVWERLLETGIILLSPPEEKRVHEAVCFVREYGRFGKASFRKVTRQEIEKNDPADYIPCDFGLLKEEELIRRLTDAGLTEGEMDYLLGLPWEKQIVYHKKTDRMKEIARKLKSG